MTPNAMWRYITENGTEEQAERATAIRNRLAACWQTEAQDMADVGRLEELVDAVREGA